MFTGRDMVTGKDVEQTVDVWTGRKEIKKTEPSPEAGVALGCAVAGLLMALVRKSATSLLSGIAGAGGAISLFALKMSLEEQVVNQGKGLIQLSMREGFWLAAAALVIGANVQCKMVADRSNKSSSESPKGLGGWLAIFCLVHAILIPAGGAVWLYQLVKQPRPSR